jgi:hypothetical protein
MSQMWATIACIYMMAMVVSYNLCNEIDYGCNGVKTRYKEPIQDKD